MKENSIKEAIILLKDFTEGNFKRDKLENYKGSYKMGYFYYKDIQQAIEHLLSEVDIKEKDIEGWKKYCEEIEEEQTEMSNKNYELEFEVEKLQKENEELKNQEATARRINELLVQRYSNSIPIQKIKDKIEELKEKSGGNVFHIQQTINAEIRLLKELLEESEK